MFNYHINNSVTPEMIYQAVNIDAVVYQKEFHSSYDKCLKWWKKNPNIYVMVQDDNTKKIVGYINVMPLTDLYYNKIKNGEIIDTNIPIEEIQTYKPNGKYNVYFSSIAILPEYQNTNAFKTLLKGLCNNINQLKQQKISFSNVIADTVSEIGEKFCKKMNFKFVTNTNHNSKIYEKCITQF